MRGGVGPGPARRSVRPTSQAVLKPAPIRGTPRGRRRAGPLGCPTDGAFTPARSAPSTDRPPCSVRGSAPGAALGAPLPAGARGGSPPRPHPAPSRRAIGRPERATALGPSPSAGTTLPPHRDGALGCSRKPPGSRDRVGSSLGRDAGGTPRPRSADDRAELIAFAVRPDATAGLLPTGRAQASFLAPELVGARPAMRPGRASIRGSPCPALFGATPHRRAQSVALAVPPRATGAGRRRAALADDPAAVRDPRQPRTARPAGLVERPLARDHRRRGSSRGQLGCSS